MLEQSQSNDTRCRICCAAAARQVGEVEYFIGYRFAVYDCAACGCRFTPHDPAAYEAMYAEENSCYRRYAVNAQRCQAAFARGDLAGLAAALSFSSRYRFIIEAAARVPPGARFLEIGCSRGHLTSYLLLAGRDATGVDVSPSALAAARAAFGDHFLAAGDPRIAAQAPYDVIYHVGTIGCLADPVGMTRDLLRLLKPGGRLLFNAPNRDSLLWPGQLWIDSAPPPDLVTLFAPGFWRNALGGAATVRERIEYYPAAQSVQRTLQRLLRRWRAPHPMPLGGSTTPDHLAEKFADRLERWAARVAAAAGLDRLLPPRPTEFGLFVEMTRV